MIRWYSFVLPKVWIQLLATTLAVNACHDHFEPDTIRCKKQPHYFWKKNYLPRWPRSSRRTMTLDYKYIICRDRLFKRSLKQGRLPPSATSEASSTADLHKINCRWYRINFSSFFSDLSHTTVHVELPQREATDEWVSRMNVYSSVNKLKQALSEPRSWNNSRYNFRLRRNQKLH